MHKPAQPANFYWYLPAIAWGVIILILTSMPSITPPLEFRLQDKVFHFLVYFFFGLLLVRSFSRGHIENVASALHRTLYLGIVFALFDELHQALIPGRFCDPWDALADMAGIVFSLGCYYYARTYFIKKDHAIYYFIIKYATFSK